MRFVLVHSPLVGPATWRWVAEALRASGHAVSVPDLRAAALSGDPSGVVRAARQPTSRDPVALVGHSGAGFFLPSIAAGLEGPVRRLVFVDAGAPPCEGAARAGDDVLEQLRALAADGTLPKWSTWWGTDVMETLVPDPARRNEIEAELPELPLAFFESPMHLPGGWCDAPCAYLLLSDAYRPQADKARALGWPVVEELGNHLDIVNHPEPIARRLVDLMS